MPRSDRFPLPPQRPAARACAAALLLVVACSEAAADPAGVALRLPWGAPADGDPVPEPPQLLPLAPGGDWERDTPPLQGVFLAPVPGLRIGAEAGFDRGGGGLRAMVALKLKF